ncbi:MAG TPA: hypothetical protein DCS93_12315 [Microscillaceae bacterium]|nr:hypothetical protein [Microscillaceae bacterium]
MNIKCLTLLLLLKCSIFCAISFAQKRPIKIDSILINSLSNTQLRDSIERLDSTHFVLFSFDTLRKELNLSRWDIKARVLFQGVFFKKQVEFVNTKFQEGVDFQSSTFANEVNFNQTVFAKQVNFTKTAFKNKVNFKAAVLPHKLIFKEVNLENLIGIIDLTDCRLQQSQVACNIDLNGIKKLDKILLLYTNFELYFPDNYSFQNKSIIYENLLSNLKKNGLQPSYEKLDVQYSKLKYQQKGLIGTVINIFQRYWWYYGYRKDWVIGYTLLFLSLFTLINWLLFHFIMKFMYPIDAIFSRYEKSKKEFLNYNSLVFKKRKVNRKRFIIYSIPAILLIIPFGVEKIIINTINIFIEQRESKIKRLVSIRYERIKKLSAYWKDSAFLAFFYTSFIFFGVSFDPNKLKFKGSPWVIRIIYFFTVYVIGLLCLAYLISFVIIR